MRPACSLPSRALSPGSRSSLGGRAHAYISLWTPGQTSPPKPFPLPPLPSGFRWTARYTWERARSPTSSGGGARGFLRGSCAGMQAGQKAKRGRPKRWPRPDVLRTPVVKSVEASRYLSENADAGRKQRGALALGFGPSDCEIARVALESLAEFENTEYVACIPRGDHSRLLKSGIRRVPVWFSAGNVHESLPKDERSRELLAPSPCCCVPACSWG